MSTPPTEPPASSAAVALVATAKLAPVASVPGGGPAAADRPAALVGSASAGSATSQAAVVKAASVESAPPGANDRNHVPIAPATAPVPASTTPSGPSTPSAPSSSAAAPSLSPGTSASLGDALRRPSTQLPRSEPRSKAEDLKYTDLLHSTFRRIPRIDITSPPETIRALIKDFVEEKGVPLVIAKHNTDEARWNQAGFDLANFRDLAGGVTPVSVQNLLTGQELNVRLDELLTYARIAKPHILSHDTSRLYSKDVKCPRTWRSAIMDMVPPEVAYHRGEDAVSSLSTHQRPESLTCHFGPGDTWTTLSSDVCASLGQSLMAWSDPNAGSWWFITASEHSNDMIKYLEKLGKDDVPEGVCLTMQELQAAPFPIHVTEQHVGDLVLLPSRAWHQSINKGGRTLRVMWSRLTVSCLEMTLHEDLPLYQRYCQKEIFRVRAVIEANLRRTADSLPPRESWTREKHAALTDDFRTLLTLYDQILADEYSPDWRSQTLIGSPDAYVECDFCGAHVLQSFFECPEGNTVCPMCYCQGRLCPCGDPLALKPNQLHPFTVRLQLRNDAVEKFNASAPEEFERCTTMTETDLVQSSFPRSFTAACKLRKMRESPDVAFATCRICKAVLNNTSRYKCRPCHCSYCFGCLLFRFYIHPVYALAQEFPERFHEYHKGASKQDYDEWKAEPESFRIEARANFELIEAALTNLRCRPIVEGCKLGFLDQTDEYPNGTSGTLPPPPLGGDGSKRKEGAKRQAESANASPATTSTAKRPRKSSPGSRVSLLDMVVNRANGNGKAATPSGSSLPSTPANGKAPVVAASETPVVATQALVSVPGERQSAPMQASTASGSGPRSIKVISHGGGRTSSSSAAASSSSPSSSAAATNGTISAVLPSITEIFNLLDKENRKREVLAQQRHQQLVRMIQDNASKSSAMFDSLSRRLSTLEEQMDDLLDDITRGAEMQTELDQGRVPSGKYAVTSNVRGAMGE